MYRFLLLAGLALLSSGCALPHPGRVILTEDTKERYLQLREGWGNCVGGGPAYVANRPDLQDVCEVRGDLEFVCGVIHGESNPRIVVESKNKAVYQVAFQPKDRDALRIIAKRLGLVITQQEREIMAFTIRIAPGGHRLKPAAEGKHIDPENVCLDDEGWPLDGVTADELARFLEIRCSRPVVNLTGLQGRWAILLSDQAAKLWPSDEKKQLDNLGLELRWEKVRVPVTVVKDKSKQKQRGDCLNDRARLAVACSPGDGMRRGGLPPQVE